MKLKPQFLLFLFFMTISKLPAATVDTLDIFSPAMQKDIRCLVILPSNYTVSGAAFPVVYLLHGYSGNFAGWLGDAPQIQNHADTYNFIIVCPDGGYDSWYLDSPVDSTVRYETHIIQEVVPFVDYFFNTKKEKTGRAIAGLSMGGHGAMLLSARNPEIFGAVGSICGGLDLRPFKKNDWDLKSILGNPSDFWDNWERFSVVNQAKIFKTAGIELILDCGLDDFFLPVNREMHRLLLEEDVPHEYTERPGEHNSDFWKNSIDHQLLFFHKFFVENAAAGKN